MRSKHAIVVCNNPSNWPEQQVITDAMEKGKVPLSIFVKIMYGHKAWLGEHSINNTELAFIAVTSFAHSMRDASMAFGPTLCLHTQIEEITADDNNITDEHTEEAADDADKHSEEANGAPNVKDLDKEVATHDDEAAPTVPFLKKWPFEVEPIRDPLAQSKVRKQSLSVR